MKEYPSIPKLTNSADLWFGFDKLDGSNIRAEWNRNKGFTKFGSRHKLIDESDLQLGKSIPLIKEKYEWVLDTVFKKLGYKKSICFFEYYGPSSFAGNHNPSEEQTVTLIDFTEDNKGIVFPKDFILITQRNGIETAKLIFQGKPDQVTFDSIDKSKMEGMTFEGVVFKANKGTPGLPYMFKVKSEAWLEKLETFCKGDVAMFRNLE